MLNKYRTISKRHKICPGNHASLLAIVLVTVNVVAMAGCARIVVTRDANGNNVSVQVEPAFALQSGKAPNVAAQTKTIAQMETLAHQRINEQRQKRGLKPLRANPTLGRIARDYSRRMSKGDFFSHYDPAGKSVADRVRSAGLSYSRVGENIAKSTNAPDPVATAVTGWMNSKGHRENILRPQYTESGLGVWKDGRTYHFTQIFMRPM